MIGLCISDYYGDPGKLRRQVNKRITALEKCTLGLDEDSSIHVVIVSCKSCDQLLEDVRNAAMAW